MVLPFRKRHVAIAQINKCHPIWGCLPCNIKYKKKKKRKPLKDGPLCFRIHSVIFGVDSPFLKEWLCTSHTF